jgi:beta-glucosidase-like glycosyl hydrolase
MALVRAVERGLVSEAQMDESVRRVLRDKFALGLFENPYVREDPVEIRTCAGEGDTLSRRLSEQAVTLLKNEGGLLPLSRELRKVAAKLGFLPDARRRRAAQGGLLRRSPVDQHDHPDRSHPQRPR